LRDRAQEVIFKAIYGPQALGRWFYAGSDVEAAQFSPILRSKREQAELDAAIERVKSRIEQGGFAEGWARIVALLLRASGGINELELEAGRRKREQHPLLSKLSHAERKRLLKEQSYMVQLDEDRAVRALPHMVSTPEMRREAMDIARAIAIGDGVVDATQQAVLARLAKALDLPDASTTGTAVAAAQPVTA
jgi:tellurite resistance protein